MRRSFILLAFTSLLSSNAGAETVQVVTENVSYRHTYGSGLIPVLECDGYPTHSVNGHELPTSTRDLRGCSCTGTCPPSCQCEAGRDASSSLVAEFDSGLLRDRKSVV